MKKHCILTLSFAVLGGMLLTLTGCRTPSLNEADLQAPAPKIAVLYPQWKYKALTFSYDDGLTEDRKLVSIFNKYALKATFNLSSGRLGEVRKRNVKLSEIKKLYTGHEVASHGRIHLPMPKQKPATINHEIVADQEVLGKAVGYPIRGFAYPFGQSSKEVAAILKKNNIAYARLVGSSRNFSLPKDFLFWRPTAHHNHNISGLADRFLALPEKELALFYVWGHSYEFPKHKNWDMMEKFCQKISGKANIWYATNIEVCDYLNAAKLLTFTHGKRAGKNTSTLPLYLLVNGKKIVLAPGESFIVKKNGEFIPLAK